MLELFWPTISDQTGVANPNRTPQFLTLETAQYYMAHVVRPLIEEKNFFDSLTINRNRIFPKFWTTSIKLPLWGSRLTRLHPD